MRRRMKSRRARQSRGMIEKEIIDWMFPN